MEIMSQLMFSLEERHVNRSVSLVSERDWMMTVVTYRLSFQDLLRDYSPSGLFGKMSPECSRQTEEGILVPFSGRWQNSGMGFATEFLTLSTSEHNDFHEQSHKGEGVSSLSDILETGDLPQQLFLSEKACRGMILRAERKKKKQILSTLENALALAVNR